MKRRVFLAIIVTLLLICLSVPYFQVNHLTKKYGSDFLDLYSENGFYDDMEYLKVFQYRDEKINLYYLDNDRLKQKLSNLGDEYAVVLYVEENHSSASLFIFYDEAGRWKLSDWDLIWSSSGSADGFMWPYFY